MWHSLLQEPNGGRQKFLNNNKMVMRTKGCKISRTRLDWWINIKVHFLSSTTHTITWGERDEPINFFTWVDKVEATMY